MDLAEFVLIENSRGGQRQVFTVGSHYHDAVLLGPSHDTSVQRDEDIIGVYAQEVPPVFLYIDRQVPTWTIAVYTASFLLISLESISQVHHQRRH